MSIATSGNYRNYYVKDGVKYAHTLDPSSLSPVQHDLLSVTVITPVCARADAFATAFMVMGEKKTLEFIKAYPELEIDVYMLSSAEGDSFRRSSSKGFDRYFE